MKRVYKKFIPPKIAEMPQILTQIFSKGFTMPHGGVKINKDAFSRPFPETRTIKGFQKMAILSLKDGLKGVLKGVKWVLKEITIFAQKHQMSQPPIFRFLDLAAKNAKDHEGKKEVIWQ
jgi:hypothetical protein